MSRFRVAHALCGGIVAVVHVPGTAWLPSPIMKPARPTQATKATIVDNGVLSMSALRAAPDDVGGDGGRPNLRALQQGFERSMDSKLVMGYVQELRARKQLLLASLEETGGVITDDIYSIIGELALVNPSGGIGKGNDKGRDHYNAMLPGHWIAASTIVPSVPYVSGEGEARPKATARDPSSLPSNGVGPTCTLGELSKAVSGHECTGDFDADVPVRPLRVRLSALPNTLDKTRMPTVVTVAGFNPAAPESGLDNGAVRGRGKWVARGGNHLRWDFETMNVDLGGDRIAKTEANSEGGDAGGATDGSSQGNAKRWGGRDLHEFFLDQNMLIVAWTGDMPKKEEVAVFVRDELPR